MPSGTVRGDPIFAATGLATIAEGITMLRVEVSLSSARPGPYLLQLREPMLAWNSYPIVVD